MKFSNYIKIVVLLASLVVVIFIGTMIGTRSITRLTTKRDPTGLHIIRDCTTFRKKYTVNVTLTVVPMKQPPCRCLESRADSKTSFRQIADGAVWGGGKKHPSSTCGNERCRHVVAMLHSVVNYVKKELGLSRVKMLDVPCGDMIWMPLFLEARRDVDYTGFDIVSEMIIGHRKNFASKHPDWRFSDRDIVVDGLNESYDVVLNRQMLQHLYLDDALRFLHAISASGSKFLFITTTSNYDKNTELAVQGRAAGRSRYLNLELPPISLPPPLCHSLDSGSKYLALFSLPLTQIVDCPKVLPLSAVLNETGAKYYVCSK